MLDYLAQTFVRLFNNHGLLTVGPQLAWRGKRRQLLLCRAHRDTAPPASGIASTRWSWPVVRPRRRPCWAMPYACQRDLLGRFAYSTNEVWLHAHELDGSGGPSFHLRTSDVRRRRHPGWRGARRFTSRPSCRSKGGYRFRFRLDRARAHVDVNYHDGEGLMLATSVGGRREPLTDAGVLRRFLGNPTMTFAVIVRIHWQALHLLCKRARFHAKLAPPIGARDPLTTFDDA